MKKLIMAMCILGAFGVSAAIECESTKLNQSDVIEEAFVCDLVEMKKGSNNYHFTKMCVVKTKTMENEHYKTIEAVNGSEYPSVAFSTFKWLHTRNNSSSKRFENSSRLILKDIYLTGMLTSKLVEKSIFNKIDLTLKTQIYSYPILFPVNRYVEMKAHFKCQRLI